MNVVENRLSIQVKNVVLNAIESIPVYGMEDFADIERAIVFFKKNNTIETSTPAPIKGKVALIKRMMDTAGPYDAEVKNYALSTIDLAIERFQCMSMAEKRSRLNQPRGELPQVPVLPPTAALRPALIEVNGEVFLVLSPTGMLPPTEIDEGEGLLDRESFLNYLNSRPT